MFLNKTTLKVVVTFVTFILVSSCSNEEALANTTSNQTIKPQAISLEVYKSPTCGCCKKWVNHINQQGFATKVTEFHDVASIKDTLGIKPNLRSCHTAISSQGYAFEGHIPAKFIKQFLKENHSTDVIGLSVPGMPLGSPGMQVGDSFQPYSILLLKTDGSYEIYQNVKVYEEQF